MNDPRLGDLLDYLESYHRKHGFSPSYQECADTLGYFSKATVKADLEELRDRGLVTWSPGKARTVRVIDG